MRPEGRFAFTERLLHPFVIGDVDNNKGQQSGSRSIGGQFQVSVKVPGIALKGERRAGQGDPGKRLHQQGPGFREDIPYGFADNF